MDNICEAQLRERRGIVCPTAAAVADEIARRADFGLSKYGTTLAAAPLTRLQVLQLAKEEAMDLAIYLQRLIEAEGQP